MLAQSRSRLATLFDTRFADLVTPQIVALMYILAIVGDIMFVTMHVVVGFSQSTGAGVLMLLLSPLVFAIGLLAIRIGLELIIVVFRVERHLSELSRIARQQPHTD